MFSTSSNVGTTTVTRWSRSETEGGTLFAPAATSVVIRISGPGSGDGSNAQCGHELRNITHLPVANPRAEFPHGCCHVFARDLGRRVRTFAGCAHRVDGWPPPHCCSDWRSPRHIP